MIYNIDSQIIVERNIIYLRFYIISIFLLLIQKVLLWLSCIRYNFYSYANKIAWKGWSCFSRVNFASETFSELFYTQYIIAIRVENIKLNLLIKSEGAQTIPKRTAYFILFLLDALILLMRILPHYYDTYCAAQNVHVSVHRISAWKRKKKKNGATSSFLTNREGKRVVLTKKKKKK